MSKRFKGEMNTTINIHTLLLALWDPEDEKIKGLKALTWWCLGIQGIFKPKFGSRREYLYLFF